MQRAPAGARPEYQATVAARILGIIFHEFADVNCPANFARGDHPVRT